MQKISNKLQATLKYIKSHKLVSFLTVILLIIVGNFAYNKYLDWDNAQMIKGLSNDFPVLVQEVEAATDLELKIESSCQQTQEKFSDGVSLCIFSISKNPISVVEASQYEQVLRQQNIIKIGRKDENKSSPWYEYRNKTACDVVQSAYIYISCQTGVRDANKSKLSELLR